MPWQCSSDSIPLFGFGFFVPCASPLLCIVFDYCVLISGVESEFGTWFGLAMPVNLQCLYINVSLTVFVQRPAFSHVLLLSAHIFKSTRLSLQICLFVFRFTSISSHSLLDLAHRPTEFMALHAVLLLYERKKFTNIYGDGDDDDDCAPLPLKYTRLCTHHTRHGIALALALSFDFFVGFH